MCNRAQRTLLRGEQAIDVELIIDKVYKSKPMWVKGNNYNDNHTSRLRTLLLLLQILHRRQMA